MGMLDRVDNEPEWTSTGTVSDEEYSEALTDYYEIANEALLDCEALITCEVGLEQLDKQLESVKLSNESYVEYANESIKTTMKVLGASEEEIEEYSVSTESIGSFITKVFDSVKLLFKKIATAIKKVVTKMIVMLNNVSDKSKRLLKALKTAKVPVASKISPEEAKEFNKYYNAYAGITNRTSFEGGLVTGLLNYYKNEVPSNITEAIKVIDKLKDTISEDNEPAGNVEASRKYWIELISKLISGLKTKNLPSTLDYDAPEKGTYKVLTFGARGKNVKAIEVLNDEYGLKFKVISISTKDELDGDIKVMDLGTLKNVVNFVERHASNLKSFSTKRLTEISKMEKELDKLADARSQGSALKKMVLKMKASVGTNSRALVAGVYLDSILAYDSAIRKAYSFAKVQSNYYNINEL